MSVEYKRNNKLVVSTHGRVAIAETIQSEYRIPLDSNCQQSYIILYL